MSEIRTKEQIAEELYIGLISRDLVMGHLREERDVTTLKESLKTFAQISVCGAEIWEEAKNNGKLMTFKELMGNPSGPEKTP